MILLDVIGPINPFKEIFYDFDAGTEIGILIFLVAAVAVAILLIRKRRKK